MKRIVRTEPDRILYVDRFDQAMTAFIEARDDDGTVLCKVLGTAKGFPL